MPVSNMKKAVAKKAVKKRKLDSAYNSFSNKVGFNLIHGAQEGLISSRKVKAVLTYAQPVTLAVTTAITQHQTFRLNSLFDPDYTGSGTQPSGFDQLALLYRVYQVKYVKVKFTVYNVTLTTPVVVSIRYSNNSTLDVLAQDAIMVPNTDYHLMLPYNQEGAGPHTFTKTIDVSKFLAEAGTEDSLAAIITANPANLLFGTIQMHTLSGAPATGYCEGLMEIEFHTEFSQLRNTPPS